VSVVVVCCSDVSQKLDEVSVESDDDDHSLQHVSKFGLLNIEDASASDSDPDSDTVSTATKQTGKKKQTMTLKADDKTVNKVAAKKQANKGKKSKDEDDIDELLAELDAPKSAKSADKKERKKKKGGAVEDLTDQADTSTQPAAVEPEIDYRNMTQDEIAKLMEQQYGEDSDDERKKARGKKKMRKAKDEAKRQVENGELEIEHVNKHDIETGMSEIKNVDVDVDKEAADDVPKPSKKQNKKMQQKQAEVLFVYMYVLAELFIRHVHSRLTS